MIVLGIESAISEGSLAVLQGDDVLATFTGGSRAESIISGIGSVVADAGLTLSDIDLISVSRGPGSFTGTRIGIATAVGLARALQKTYVGVSLFDAIAGSTSENKLSVVISIGRNQYGVQTFVKNGDSPSEPKSIPQAGLIDTFNEQRSERILFCGALNEALSLPTNVEMVAQQLAELIARQALRANPDASLQPIYLGK